MFSFNAPSISGVALHNLSRYCEKMLTLELLIMGYFKTAFNNLVCSVEWVFFYKITKLHHRYFRDVVYADL